MFSKKIVFKNELTLLLEDPGTDLEKVLLHHELSYAIQNESVILYKRIFDDDSEWFKKIINYALFDLKPPVKYQENNRIFQINHNASNFLVNCQKKFKKFLIKSNSVDYLIEFLNRFISKKNRTNKNPMYAGHFQRIVENLIQLEIFDDFEDFLNKIIPFLVENCRILAYQQLIIGILRNSSSIINEDIIYSILKKILFQAFGAVNYIYNKNLKLNSSVLPEIFDLKDEYKLTKSSQPYNLNGKSIPIIINMISDSSNDEANMHDDELDYLYQLEKKINNNLDFNNIEDAEIEAYLLIMSIRTSAFANNDLFYLFRDDEQNDFQLIEILLYCGTCCSDKSIISLEAFKILDVIFNGSFTFSIDPWFLLELDKEKLNFYNYYADNFTFSAQFLTYQMVHALPIFWDHCYNKNSYDILDDKEIDVSDYYSDIDKKIKKKWKRKGETALEIIQPCLICEPPISSSLNYTVTKIYMTLCKYRHKLRYNKVQTIDIRDRMLYIDGNYYEFFNHHFIINSKQKRLIDIIKIITPLPPTDKLYTTTNRKRRAPLNGFFIDFAFRICSSSFFDISDDIRISKIGHSNMMDIVTEAIDSVSYYKREVNYKLLSLHILYNIPIYYVSKDLSINEEEEEEVYEFCISNIFIKNTFDEEQEKNNLQYQKLKQKAEEAEKQLSQKTEEIKKYKQQIDQLKSQQNKMIQNTSSAQENSDITILNTSTLKNYIKRKELGRGENGTVYEVTKEEPYVFKELSKHDVESFRNLIKEYEIINFLHHPNIIKAYGIHLSDETTPPTIVLEYCPQNIQDVIQNKTFSEPQIVYSIYQIAEGMKYVHFRKVIHRDIKPTNIMIAKDGTVKICDFGISKIVDSESIQISMTKGLGTMFFMAPEILNEENYDEKVDVYSFGVLLFFILSGGKMPKIVIRDICLGKKAKIPEEINEFSRDLINSCWNFDPKQRPSFDQICSMLEENDYQLIDLDADNKYEALNLINEHKKRIPIYSH